MICKQCFALELLDRVILHTASCFEQSSCQLCRIYNALLDELATPISHEIDWIQDARERFVERSKKEMDELHQEHPITGDLDVLEKPV